MKPLSNVLLVAGFATIGLYSAFEASIVKAQNIFRPSSFIVRFYEIGFVNTTTGSTFEVLNSTSGVDVNLSDPGSTTLASNVRPLIVGTYDAVYTVIANRYRVSGGDGLGCYVKSGNYTVANIGGIAGYASVTTNSQDAATVSNPAELWENTFGAGTNPLFYGPASPSVTSSANNNVVTLNSYLTTAAQPRNINVSGPPATRARNLFVGTLSQPLVVTSQNAGIIQFTVNTSQAGNLTPGCTRFNLGPNIQFGFLVTES